MSIPDRYEAVEDVSLSKADDERGSDVESVGVGMKDEPVSFVSKAKALNGLEGAGEG
jgi:hypothetical protein